MTIAVSWDAEPISRTIRIVPESSTKLDVPPAVFTRVGSPVSFDVKLTTDSQGMNVLASPLPAGATFSNLKFSWTPDASAIGEHQVLISAQEVLGPATTAVVRVVVRAAVPSVHALVNPAGFTVTDECTPNSLMTLLGEGFSLRDPALAANFPLPTELGGVSVRINGTAAPLLYVGDDTIHFQCPALPPNTTLEIVLDYESTPSADSPARSSRAMSTVPVIAKMVSSRPGIYLLSGTQGAVVHDPTSKIAGPPTPEYATNAASAGDFILIFGNGMGDATQTLAPGEAAPLDHLVHSAALVLVDFGDGIKVPADFAGLAPGTSASSK